MIQLSRPLINDELWWSGLARHFELVGLNSLVPRHCKLVGNRRSLGSPLFPRQLDALVGALDVTLTPEHVIEKHSMLPLFRVFTRPKKVQRAIIAIRGNGNAERALGLIPAEDYAVTLRMCPVCRDQDWVDYGAAAWRCSHQAPGCVVCHKHGCALAATIVSCRATQYVSLTTLDSVKTPKPISIPSEHQDTATKISCSMHALLSSVIMPVDQARLAQLYRMNLRVMNLVDDFDRLRLREFTNSFNQRFGSLFSVIGCRAPNPAERDNWLARLVRRPRSEQSPLRHILLILFLGLEVIPALTSSANLSPYAGRQCAPSLPLRRSARITEIKVQAKREEWLAFMKSAMPGAIRAQNDTLYSWLWRNDRAWLANTMNSR